jgi:hypothetical protein
MEKKWEKGFKRTLTQRYEVSMHALSQKACDAAGPRIFYMLPFLATCCAHNYKIHCLVSDLAMFKADNDPGGWFYIDIASTKQSG